MEKMAKAKKKASRTKVSESLSDKSTVQSPTPQTMAQRTELVGLVIVGTACLFSAALWSYQPADMEVLYAGRGGEDIANVIGPVGARIADLLLQLLGFGAYALNALLLVMGMRTLLGRNIVPRPRTLAGMMGVSFATLVLLHLWARGVGFRPWDKDAAGLVGGALAEVLRTFLSTAGTAIVATLVLFLSISALSGRPLVRSVLGAILNNGQRLGVLVKAYLLDLYASARSRKVEAVEPDEDLIAEGATVEELVDEQERLTSEESRLPSISLPPELTVDTEKAEVEPQTPRFSADGFPLGTTVQPDPDLVPAALRMARRSNDDVDSPEDSEESGQQRQDTQSKETVHGDKQASTTAPGGSAAPTTADDSQDEAGAQHPVDSATADGEPGPRIVETEALKPVDSSDAHAVQGELAIDGDREWQLPLPTLVQEPPSRKLHCNTQVLRDNATVLEQKLADFKIIGEVTNILPGPVVTTYEFRPAPGVKISRIVNVKDDLTMSLSALRVRVVAPIPGRDVVGIEVPNKKRQIVYFREVIDSRDWRESEHPLTLVLGKDIEGRAVTSNLAKAPHLLVAGATGTGKSVGINSFICSMLYKARPTDLRLILIDPKVIELAVYEGIPHLLLPVIDDMSKADLALKWAVREMERRYKVMAGAKVRNIAGYRDRVPELQRLHETKRVRVLANSTELVDADAPGSELLDPPPAPEQMPYIVVVIDEFADLIMQCGKDVERAVARLAQKARASGIHVILATQRPSTDVITGMIKANFSSRISFKVASSIDSKVVINSVGAESLLGNGDMLFMPPGTSILRRCHGTWITDDEVIAIASHWREQGQAMYEMDILVDLDTDAASGVDNSDLDELYVDAVRIAIEADQASVSFLQRKLSIGYGRAARIVDHMEARGIIGPPRGPNKPREVLASQMP
jgi:S-DNA-T family DNA segregation ATPase FtsK/SpoIIIE